MNFQLIWSSCLSSKYSDPGYYRKIWKPIRCVNEEQTMQHKPWRHLRMGRHESNSAATVIKSDGRWQRLLQVLTDADRCLLPGRSLGFRPQGRLGPGGKCDMLPAWVSLPFHYVLSSGLTRSQNTPIHSILFHLASQSRIEYNIADMFNVNAQDMRFPAESINLIIQISFLAFLCRISHSFSKFSQIISARLSDLQAFRSSGHEWLCSCNLKRLPARSRDFLGNIQDLITNYHSESLLPLNTGIGFHLKPLRWTFPPGCFSVFLCWIVSRVWTRQAIHGAFKPAKTLLCQPCRKQLSFPNRTCHPFIEITILSCVSKAEHFFYFSASLWFHQYPPGWHTFLSWFSTFLFSFYLLLFFRRPPIRIKEVRCVLSSWIHSSSIL